MIGVERKKPRLLITLGDVAGIGPEVLVKAWTSGALHALAAPAAVGDAGRIAEAVRQLNVDADVVEVAGASEALSAASDPRRITCIRGSETDVSRVPLGRIDAAAGKAAFDYLCTAIDHTLAGQADAIVTLPLHKESLHAARLSYPGHTEILAARTNACRYGMMLYARRPMENAPAGGVAVIHATLHLPLCRVFERITTDNVLEKIELAAEFMERLLPRRPRIAVCGLNPHAGDGGLFGSEETERITPAVRRAQESGLDATGPWPADSVFGRAFRGDFDAVVAMYHDQGHIPFKLHAGMRAVNVSVGLPIVRTSVAHGTGHDIAGRGVADPTSLIEACRLAAEIVRPPLAQPAPTPSPP